jgi:DnaJ-class molecular chaperone
VKIGEVVNMDLSIPPGINNGEVIIIRDIGNHVVDHNLKGELKLIVAVKNETPFERNGLDLIYKKTLTLKEALTGFSFTIDHLNGKEMEVNNSHTKTIVKPGFQKSIPQLGFTREGQTGKLIVDFHIEFPEYLSDEQMESLKQVL